MLIEVKVKVVRVIDEKTRKKSENYLVENCELFVEAENKVMSELVEEKKSHLLEDFEIQSLKISQIKEVYTQYTGDTTFVVTLKDIFLETDGTEKVTKYKILLWAKDVAEATKRATELAKQGYDMVIESIKEANYTYLNSEDNAGTSDSTEAEA